jgi:nitroimidazol reductase NimA-like FMN-containing flavoprotein (pyridoxamine 5'-phosphate oxidase superfamily)
MSASPQVGAVSRSGVGAAPQVGAAQQVGAAPPSGRTKVRKSERAAYDRSAIYAILDEALICHVGFVVDEQPYVIPTIHARVEDRLYIHGAAATRMLRVMRGGAPVCVTVTLLDGLVMARSAFHHSMNYRSVVVLGTAADVTDAGEKLNALQAIVEHIAPGRWADCRRPNSKELVRTQVLSLPISEASAKVRTGPPGDEAEDYDLGVWAGEIPLKLTASPPIDDPVLSSGIVAPDYAARYERGDRTA